MTGQWRQNGSCRCGGDDESMVAERLPTNAATDGGSLMTERLSAQGEGIARAARILRDGGLVAFPTETVYGLGADATSAEAVAGIYAAKERPRFNPLIAHVPSLAAAREHGLFSADALVLAEAFWPGPLTLVVPVAPGGT